MELCPQEVPLLVDKPFAIVIRPCNMEPLIVDDLESIARALECQAVPALERPMLTFEEGSVVLQSPRAPLDLLKFVHHINNSSTFALRVGPEPGEHIVYFNRTVYVKPGKRVLVLTASGLTIADHARSHFEKRLIMPKANDATPDDGDRNQILAYKMHTYTGTSTQTGIVEYVVEWNTAGDPPSQVCLPVYAERPEYELLISISVKAPLPRSTKCANQDGSTTATQTTTTESVGTIPANDAERPIKRSRQDDS